MSILYHIDMVIYFHPSAGQSGALATTRATRAAGAVIAESEVLPSGVRENNSLRVTKASSRCVLVPYNSIRSSNRKGYNLKREEPPTPGFDLLPWAV